MKATLGNLSIKRLWKNRAILILPFWNNVKAVQVQELPFLKIYMKVILQLLLSKYWNIWGGGLCFFFFFEVLNYNKTIKYNWLNTHPELELEEDIIFFIFF